MAKSPPHFTWPRFCLPQVVIAGRFPFSPSSVGRDYRHPTYALHQHHYHARLEFGRRVFELRPGDVTLTPPETVSRYELKEEGYHWCIHFCPASIAGRPATLTLPWHIPWCGGVRVADQMGALSSLFGSGKTRAQKELSAATSGAMLQALLLQLALSRTQPERQGPESRAERLLDAAKDQIERTFHRPLNISDVARASGLSRNYFSARFRARFGRTPQGYLLHCRMEAARALLISTNLAVKEIAFECGLPDPQHFNKQFRQAAGMSPSAYRQRPAREW